MPNKYWNNMHGSNYSASGGKKEKSGAPAKAGASPEKTANWPGVPGKTQSKDRSAGVKKSGYKGAFYVKKTGI